MEFKFYHPDCAYSNCRMPKGREPQLCFFSPYPRWGYIQKKKSKVTPQALKKMYRVLKKQRLLKNISIQSVFDDGGQWVKIVKVNIN